MKLLKGIMNKKRILDQELVTDLITWSEFKRQWLEENKINCNYIK